MTDKAETSAQPPPLEKRFGLKRRPDGELLATGPVPALRKLRVVLGVEWCQVVRLKQKRRRRR